MAEDIIEKCNQLIKSTESVVEYNKQFEKNRVEIKEKEAELITIKKDMAKFIRQYLVKILLRDVNTRTNEYIEMRQNENDLSPVSDIDILKRVFNCTNAVYAEKNFLTKPSSTLRSLFKNIIQIYLFKSLLKLRMMFAEGLI